MVNGYNIYNDIESANTQCVQSNYNACGSDVGKLIAQLKKDGVLVAQVKATAEPASNTISPAVVIGVSVAGGVCVLVAITLVVVAVRRRRNKQIVTVQKVKNPTIQVATKIDGAPDVSEL